MKTLIIWICSFLIAGIIISPFFWLRFLKEKNRWQYVILSSTTTLVIFLLYIYFGYDFINNWTAKINADLYYMAYDFIQYAIYVVLLLIILSPFIFTKIIYNKIDIKSFFISLIISVSIVLVYAIIFVYIIFPMAVGVIFKNLN